MVKLISVEIPVNPTLWSEAVRRAKATDDSIEDAVAAFLRWYAKDWPGSEELPKPERLDVLVGAAMRKLRAAEGEWVAWRTIRPPYRDRPLYDEAVWDQITKSLVVESHDILHGKTVRRQAKFVGPL